MQSPADAEPAVGAKVKPKRTYRACQPCRARKLKCDLGDPDNPSEPPCKRCRRESRECVFVQRANAKTYLEPSPSSGNPSLPLTTVVPQRPNKARKSAHSVSQVDAAPGPSAARAAAHPYAQSPAAGWGPSPGSSNDRANSATPGESNGPRGQYFLPSVAASGAANHASPYDPNFPLIPHLPLHTTNAVASTSHLEHDSTFPPQNPPPPPATGASSSLQQHSAAQKQQGSPPPQHAMQSDGEDGDERASDEDDDMEDDDGESGSAAGSSRGRGGGRGRGEAPSSLLLSSTLHNPSDALKLLATASSLRSLSTDLASRAAQEGRGRGDGHGNGEEGRGGAAGGSSGPFAATGKTGLGLGAATTARGKSKERRVEKEDEVPQAAGWERWTPVVEGMVTVTEAEVLLSFFQEHMSPLYPLLSPRIFTAAHLSSLTSRESLLLAAMICISARYSSLPSPARALRIHHEVSDYINGELIGLLDGSGELRHISSVEALLLLTEWPPIADSRARRGRTATARGRGWRGSEAQTVQVDENDGDGPKAENLVEDAEALLKTSARYDSMSWSFIGCAVRLAQELGIHNLWFGKEHGVTWHEERCLRTWIYCYNADRHVSVRLGRNAVIQAYMSSSWWEQVTSRASQDVRGEGLSEVWAERTLPQGLIAALMGTIQERLYPNKEITRSMIRSGHWESFIRSLEHELQMMQLKSRIVLQAGNIESTLLEMEFMYTRLYGNAIALRALQERLRRAVKAHDLWFVSPSLLNLQEGQWVLDALSAAQSILDKTCNYLAPKGYLRVAPSRIFQRILFASTFLFKALAVGVVEHGQSKVMDLLDQTITVLHTQAVDRQHIAHGFAALLRRLQAQCKPTLLSRFGVRPAVSGVEAGTTPAPSGPGTPAAPPHHAPSPFPRQAPQLPAMPPRTTATATTSNQQSDPLLAPTPGPSLPGSASATPRNGFNPLPPLHEDNTGGMLPSPSFPHPQGYPSAATAAGLNFYNPAGFAGGPLPPGIPPYGAQPSWYGAMPEPTNELGAFQLGGVPAGYDLGNPFEWDPTASNIAVGKEQDLLFQSLWGGSGVLGGIGESGGGVNPALNLFGTLGLTGGDEFGLE